MIDPIATSGTLARMVRLDPVRPDPRHLLRAAGIIRQGGLVAYPTETFYGLGVDPYRREAVARLFAAKGRDAGRAVILLLSHADQAFDVGAPTSGMKVWLDRLARAFWPGPLTVVLPARESPAIPALGGAATVAVRVSSCPVAWQLVRTVGAPITSTSANLSGAPPAALVDAIDRALLERIDLILDAGPTSGGPPSTLLDLTRERPAILRQGSVTAEAVAGVLGVSPRLERAG
ncbi:MAG TPA: L-threonylcarbamoyladenylate synthase [Candidatus Polarisedimenticolia bacterium]|jgi:L-threonylcarbamoyladenylate synthase